MTNTQAEEEAELADIEAFFECKRTPSVGSARSLINPRFKDDGHSRLIEGDRLSMHSEYCNSKAMHSPDNKVWRVEMRGFGNELSWLNVRCNYCCILENCFVIKLYLYFKITERKYQPSKFKYSTGNIHL